MFCHTVNPDIVIVNETKLDDSVYSSEFPPNHYSAHRLDRSIHGGDVMVAVRNNLIVDDITLEQVDREFVAVWIATKNASPLYVADCYQPLDEPADRLEKFEAVLDQLPSETDGNNKVMLLIGRGFNSGDVDWEKGTVKENS